MPETVQSDGSVAPEGRATDEIGEFTCCAAALAIHLEEALLPVQVTESPGEIRAGAAGERWHTLGVARHGHRVANPELTAQAQADIAECQAETPPRAAWGVPGEPCMRERGYYVRRVE